MKRTLAWILVLALALLLLPAISAASEEGEMLLASEPVQGAVGDIVAVDFYCYPNLPEGILLDSLEGTLLYDAEFLTLGSINLRDEEQNLSSLMNSKGPIWMPNTTQPGELKFAYADTFGTDAQGFLFQIEFRIEKEGATAFVFNSIRYHGLKQEDGAYKSAGSYFINPVQIGGVHTEGYEIPENIDPDATYAPLEPAVETPPAQQTPTPKPSNSGHSVPQTTKLPEPSAQPSAGSDGVVTPKPPVTQMPMSTPGAQQTTPATQAPEETPAQGTEAPQNGDAQTPGSDPAAESTDEPIAVAEATPETAQNQQYTVEEPTLPPERVDPVPPQQTNMALVIAVIAGIVVVILLAILAIVLILIRNKKMNEQDR